MSYGGSSQSSFSQNLLWLLDYEIRPRETYKWMEISYLKKVALHAIVVVVVSIVSLMDCLPVFIGIVTRTWDWKITPI